MNKALRATILVVVFSLSFVATTQLLQGCGGGGTTIGNNLSSAQFRGLANDIPAGRHLRVLSVGFGSNTRSRSRQLGGCPRETWSGDSLTWDFGNGCYSPTFGGTLRGRISVRLVNPSYDQYGELSDVSSIEFRFDALGTPEETITGTMSLRNINREDALGLSYDLTLRGECTERKRFNGTVVYSAGWFSDRFYITGNGDYAAPAVGTVSFQMRDVQYESPGCDYPIAGRMTVAAGGQTATVTFRSICGIARVNIGGVEEDVDLDEVEFDACR